MSTYDELKEELLNIASILEKYPDSVKPQVFNLLIEQYTGSNPIKNEKKPPKKRKTTQSKNDVENTTKNRKKKVSQESYKLDKNLDLRGGKNSSSF